MPNKLTVNLQIDASPECLRRLCNGLAAAVKPDGGYKAATTDDPAPGTGCDQMVQAEWWIPQHGCDSLENTLDAIKGRLLVAVQDWLATALVPAAPPPPERGDVGELVDRLGWIAAQLGDIPKFRALCEELVEELEVWIGYGDEADCADAHAVVDRARAALAEQPTGEGPSPGELIGLALEREPWATWLLSGGCLESAHYELADLMLAVLARWARPATPPAPVVGEVGELVAWLQSMRELAGEHNPEEQRRYARAAALLQQQSAPAPVVVPVAVSKRLPRELGEAIAHQAYVAFVQICKGRSDDAGTYEEDEALVRRALRRLDKLESDHAIPLPQVRGVEA